MLAWGGWQGEDDDRLLDGCVKVACFGGRWWIWGEDVMVLVIAGLVWWGSWCRVGVDGIVLGLRKRGIGG